MEKPNQEIMQNRNAKGVTIERLVSIPAEKQKELIARYKVNDEMPEVLKARHAIFVGTWFNRTVKALEHGCTEDELDALIEHLFVVTNAGVHNLDITRSSIDHGLHKILTKYIPGKTKMEERIYNDRQKQIEHAAKKRGVLKLKSEGRSNQEIAKELGLPEATVRFFLKDVSD